MWKTTEGRRPDLEALAVNPPTEYIGGKLFPQELKSQQTGTIYYAQAESDQSAQTGRTVTGGSITTNWISSHSTTYSCAEVLGRFAIASQEVENMGGIEKADKIGGEMAKRSIMANLEAAQATAALTDGSALSYNTYGNLFALVNAGCASVKRYHGRLALACSLTTYTNIIRLPEVAERLAFTGFSFGNPADILSVRPDVLKSLVQGIFGVEEILVGDDTYWEPSGLTDRAVICKLPDVSEMSYKMGAELGKTFVYETEGGIFNIESYADEDKRANVYDGVTYAVVKALNSGAKKVLTGFAAAEKRTTVITLNGGTV